MTRLGEGDAESLPQTVLAKYDVLASIYQKVYQDRGTSGHPDSEMPLCLKMLLPVYDGWCFSPEWEAPRPVEHWSGHFLSRVDRSGVELRPSAACRLQAINGRILSRATDYRLVAYGKRLLGQALAEVDLGAQPDLSRGRDYRSLPLAEFLAVLETEQARTAHACGPTEASRTAIARLRIDWLLGWDDLLSSSVRGLRRRAGIYSKRYEVQKSISADDIAEVHGLLMRTSDPGGSHPTDLLGDWYLGTLRRCAATTLDEDRIWHTNARSIQRRSPRVLSSERAWGRIALKRLADHVNYKDRILAPKHG